MDIAEPETHKKTFKSLTAEYFENKHKDMEEVASPVITYTEYTNSANIVPGKVVEPESNEEALALVAEVAAQTPSPEKVSWFHIEGVNEHLLREIMKLLKLKGATVGDLGGSEHHSGKFKRPKVDTVRMIQLRHSEPALRWFGTHMYLSMQMLERENIDDDIPLVSDQQVSFIYVPSRRMIISIAEEVGSDFGLLRETLVNGASTCNHQSSDATMLLAVLADKILDDAFPFAEEMGDYLELLAHAMIQKPGTEYNTAADKVRMQLWRMRRFSLRLRRLAETYMEDSLQIFQNARFQEYIRVVDKQSVSMEEICAMYIDRCRNVLERIEAHQNKKTNDTLLVLTILTALMFPVQFLTGVWGMNFKNMPELNLEYGYFIFWGLVPVLSALTYWALRRKGYTTVEMDHTVGQLLPKRLVKNMVTKFTEASHDGGVGLRNIMNIRLVEQAITRLKKTPSEIAAGAAAMAGAGAGTPPVSPAMMAAANMSGRASSNSRVSSPQAPASPV